jgi:excisionase family DNA binding protein
MTTTHPGPAFGNRVGPSPSRVLYRIPEAMMLLGISRTVIYEQLRSGRLRSVKQGRTRLIPGTAIADYVALLEREATLGAAA